MASIEERSGSWRVSWRRGGRGGRKESTTWPEKRYAEQAGRIAEAHGHAITADEVYAAILGQPAPAGPKIPTVREWSTYWLDTLIGPSASTLVDYRRIVRLHLLPRLGSTYLEEIDQGVVRDWIASLAVRYKAGTIRKAHSVLHQMLATAVPQHIAANPLDHAGGRRGQRGLPKADTEEMAVLEPAEARLLVAAALPAIRDMIRVVLATGLRRGEVVALRCGDVTTTTRRDGTTRTTLEVRRALKKDGTIGPPKSRAGRRSIVVTGDAVDLLRELAKGRSPNRLLFTAPRGGQWNPHNLTERYWRPSVAAAARCPEHPPAPLERRAKTGPVRVDKMAVSECDCQTRLHKPELRFHDLRHTHASMLIAAGWDMLAIKTRMGHSSVSVTYDVYGHMLQHGQDAKLDALGEMLDGPETPAV